MFSSIVSALCSLVSGLVLACSIVSVLAGLCSTISGLVFVCLCLEVSDLVLV